MPKGIAPRREMRITTAKQTEAYSHKTAKESNPANTGWNS